MSIGHRSHCLVNGAGAASCSAESPTPRIPGSALSGAPPLPPRSDSETEAGDSVHRRARSRRQIKEQTSPASPVCPAGFEGVFQIRRAGEAGDKTRGILMRKLEAREGCRTARAREESSAVAQVLVEPLDAASAVLAFDRWEPVRGFSRRPEPEREARRRGGPTRRINGSILRGGPTMSGGLRSRAKPGGILGRAPGVARQSR